MSGQASLLPASQTLRSSDALRAMKASGSSGGEHVFEPDVKPSAFSLPPSDFLKKHLLAPPCSPYDQCVHSGSFPHARAHIPISAASNLSLFLQSFCQHPEEPYPLTSTKMA